MTNSAKGNLFINSQIHGQLELGGQSNSFIGTKIGKIKSEHPFWFWFTVAGTVIGIITGVIFLGQFFGFVPNSFDNTENITPMLSGSFATSTVPLSTLLSKALSYDTVVERQDFLTKYKGELVSGESTVSQVSRADDGFLVDFYVDRQLITCTQPGSEENEKKLLLMQGKKIRFLGSFSYTNIFNHGLGLDNCSIEQI